MTESVSYNRINEMHEKYIRCLKEMYGLIYPDILSQLPEAPNNEQFEILSDMHYSSEIESFYLWNELIKCIDLDGDICEFGVYDGSATKLIAYEIVNRNKQLNLFGFFKGLPGPTLEDNLINNIEEFENIDGYKLYRASTMNEVLSKLEAVRFPKKNLKILPVYYNDMEFDEWLPGKISFVYLKLGFYQPLKKALNSLKPYMAPNGSFFISDYQWISTGIKKAVDEFMNEHSGLYKKDISIHNFGHFCILRNMG